MKYPIRKSLQSYELKSYIHGDFIIPDDAIDCSLGINPFGCTPKITKELYAETFDGMTSYPSYPYFKLRDAIIEYLAPYVKIDSDQLTFHAGSIGMLIDLNRMFVDIGTKILAGAPSFSSAITDMRAMGGEVDLIKLKEEDAFEFSVKSYINALKPEHSLVYIDNPNNPTGQIIPIDELEELAKVCLAQDTILIIDEAYGDFMDLNNSAVSIVNKYDNVIVTKTLSKGFGLAGLRTGYAIVPKNFVEHMQKFPAEMAITEVAARIAPHALSDKEHLVKSVEKIAENKRKVLESLKVLKASKTGDTVPIVLLYTDKEVDLFHIFLKHGIISERGEDFDGIGKKHIRLRVPSELDILLPRLEKVEGELI